MLASLAGSLGLFGFFWLVDIAGRNVHHQLGELVGVAGAFHLWHGGSVPMAPGRCQ